MNLNNKEIAAVFYKVITIINEQQDKIIEERWNEYRDSEEYKSLYFKIQDIIGLLQVRNETLPEEIRPTAIMFGHSHVTINALIDKSCNDVIRGMFCDKFPRYNVFRQDVESELVIRARKADNIDDLIEEVVTYFLNKDNERNNKMATKLKT